VQFSHPSDCRTILRSLSDAKRFPLLRHLTLIITADIEEWYAFSKLFPDALIRRLSTLCIHSNDIYQMQVIDFLNSQVSCASCVSSALRPDFVLDLTRCQRISTVLQRRWRRDEFPVALATARRCTEYNFTTWMSNLVDAEDFS
jgi:hypothetical protein